MLKCATSLWSADLSRLAEEIQRVEPYSDRFHLDVADGHYVNTLLFFPDLVKAIRPCTRLPFEVHLMTDQPLTWLEPFAEAGADSFILYLDSTAQPKELIRAIQQLHKGVGISVRLDEPLSTLDPYWD